MERQRKRQRQWDVDDKGNVESNPIAQEVVKIATTIHQQKAVVPPLCSVDEATQRINGLFSEAHHSKKEKMISEETTASSNGGGMVPALGASTILFSDPSLPNTNIVKEPGTNGRYYKNIDINECKNRYALMRKEVLHQIYQDTGASILVKGKYYPSRSLALQDKELPLYLNVSADTEAQVREALKKIRDLTGPATGHSENKPPLVLISGKYVYEAKLPIGLDPIPSFGLRYKIIGPGGANMKHICVHTNSKIQIRGRGSGFIETTVGTGEADEPIYLHITNTSLEGLESAKKLCEDLINTVKLEYMEFRKNSKEDFLPPLPLLPPPPIPSSPTVVPPSLSSSATTKQPPLPPLPNPIQAPLPGGSIQPPLPPSSGGAPPTKETDRRQTDTAGLGRGGLDPITALKKTYNAVPPPDAIYKKR